MCDAVVSDDDEECVTNRDENVTNRDSAEKYTFVIIFSSGLLRLDGLLGRAHVVVGNLLNAQARKLSG